MHWGITNHKLLFFNWFITELDVFVEPEYFHIFDLFKCWPVHFCPDFDAKPYWCKYFWYGKSCMGCCKKYVIWGVHHSAYFVVFQDLKTPMLKWLKTTWKLKNRAVKTRLAVVNWLFWNSILRKSISCEKITSLKEQLFLKDRCSVKAAYSKSSCLTNTLTVQLIN